jgi:hypothetical protein
MDDYRYRSRRSAEQAEIAKRCKGKARDAHETLAKLLSEQAKQSEDSRAIA